MFPCLAAEPLPDRRDEQIIYNRAFPIKRKRKVTQSVKEKPIVYQSLKCVNSGVTFLKEIEM